MLYKCITTGARTAGGVQINNV